MSSIAINYPFSRKALRIFGTYAGPVTLAVFTYVLWQNQQTVNLASFTLYAIIDFLFFAAILKTGARMDALIPGLYGIVATAGVIVIFKNGAWTWGWIEWLTSLSVAAALLGWYKSGARMAIILGAAAISIATMPLMADAWFYDMRWTWWLWAITTACGSAIVVVRESNSPEHWIFNATGAFFNGLILLIILFK